MSQAGEINVVQNHPEIPTMFVTDSGTAIPIANTLEILGGHIAAAGTPIHTTGSTNVVTVNIQASSAQAASSASNMGGASFNNTEFTVDANGFVSLIGGGSAIDSIAMQTGTSPVVPDGSGLVTFNGAVVAAGTHPVRTDGTGPNTMALEVQTSQAIAATDATKIGLAAFDSARFTVDANGFVSMNGAGVGETITGQSGGALSPTAGNWNIFGASTAAGTSPVTTSGAVSTLTVNVQKSQAIASTDATKVGLSAFDSSSFSVDANGFVTLRGGGEAIDSIGVDASTAPGTNPVVPSVAGLVTITGAQVAAGTVGANVIRTDSLAANTLTVEIQRSTTNATTDSTKNGVSHYDSSKFTVDANGFVSTSGTGIGNTITGQSGGALSPTAGNWNIFGGSVAAGTSPLVSSGTGSTLTLNVQRSQALAAADSTKVGVSNFNSGHFSVDSNGFVSIVSGGMPWTDVTSATQTLAVQNGYFTDRSGGVTYTLPATATQGDIIKINGKLGLTTIAQNANQAIRMGSSISTTGVGGSVAGTNVGDCITLRCSTGGASTIWIAECWVGNWTVT